MYIPPVSSAASAIGSGAAGVSPSPRRPSKSTTAAARAAAAAATTAGGGKQLNRRGSLAGQFAVYMNRKAIAADHGNAGLPVGNPADESVHSHDGAAGARAPLAGALSPRMDENVANLFQIGAVVLKHGRRGRPVRISLPQLRGRDAAPPPPHRPPVRATHSAPRVPHNSRIIAVVLSRAAHARHFLSGASPRVD